MSTGTDDLSYYETELPKIIAGVRRGEKWEIAFIDKDDLRCLDWAAPRREDWEYFTRQVSDPHYRVRLAPAPVVKTLTVDELIEKYDDLREFVRVVCLQLQKHRGLSDGQKDELFQLSYRKYVQHDVEKQPRPCVKPEGGK